MLTVKIGYADYFPILLRPVAYAGGGSHEMEKKGRKMKKKMEKEGKREKKGKRRIKEKKEKFLNVIQNGFKWLIHNDIPYRAYCILKNY